MNDTEKLSVLDGSLEFLLKKHPVETLIAERRLILSLSNEEAKRFFDMAALYIGRDPEAVNEYQRLHKEKFGRPRLAIFTICNWGEHNRNPVIVRDNGELIPINMTHDEYVRKVKEEYWVGISCGLCDRHYQEEMEGLKGEQK
ncbi:MAG: hypothetical protein AABW46_01520 [Nanoarchaeota archaeon]